MKLHRQRKLNIIFNIAPLIDCVFLLLIFFLLTSSFIEDAAVKIELPESVYFDKIRLKIMSRLRYPYSGTRKKKQGDVNVNFTLSRQGDLMRIYVRNRSSVDRLFKQDSIDSIRNCSPFPEFPADIDRDVLDFSLMVSYRTEVRN